MDKLSPRKINKMKKIVAVPIWYNGTDVNATLFEVSVSNLQLGSSASIYYALYSANTSCDTCPNVLLRYGNLFIDGEDYANWGSDDDYIWIWAADKLSLTLESVN